MAIAVDSGGNVYVTGSSFDSTTGYDYCTIKYLPNGDTGWVRRYSGSGYLNGDDFAYAIALGRDGNVYVTGSGSEAYFPSSVGDYVTLKYDFAGNLKWVARVHNIFTRQGDGAFAIAVDEKENVYVTGEMSDDGEGVQGWLTVKYDSAGNELWRRVDFNNETANAIKVDSEGNVYVTGKSATAKYDSLGNLRWIQSFSGEGRAVGLDLNSNVYVTGGTGAAFRTVKYDSNGNQLWNNTYWPSLFAGGDGAHAAVLDRSSNFYVTGQTGYFEVPAWATVKYDSAGNLLWDRVLANYSSGNDVTVDDAENSFVTGSNATVKYDSIGNQLWLKDFSGEGLALALAPLGNVYVTGFAGSDFLTIKYSPLPQLKGDLNLDGILDLNDVVFALNCTFLGEPPPVAPSACDINCDGKISATDVVILLNMVFASAPAPC